MPVIGFHAQHEQAHPRDLRDSAVHAEQAGFDAVMCSDHLAPWSRGQGHSGLTWAWLTIRYQSLWPAWVSHMLADTLIDNLFKA